MRIFSANRANCHGPAPSSARATRSASNRRRTSSSIPSGTWSRDSAIFFSCCAVIRAREKASNPAEPARDPAAMRSWICDSDTPNRPPSSLAVDPVDRPSPRARRAASAVRRHPSDWASRVSSSTPEMPDSSSGEESDTTLSEASARKIASASSRSASADPVVVVMGSSISNTYDTVCEYNAKQSRPKHRTGTRRASRRHWSQSRRIWS